MLIVDYPESVTIKTSMLNVFMLNVFMLNVVKPIIAAAFK